MKRDMSKPSSHTYNFHNITTCESNHGEEQSSTWVNEIVHFASFHPEDKKEVIEHVQVVSEKPLPIPRSTSQSSSEDTAEVTSSLKSNAAKSKKIKAGFVNVTGAPTQEKRDRARKLATVARKKEKRVQESTSAAPSTRSARSDIKLYPTELSVFDLTHISHFAASRLDPFVIYPVELSYQEKKLLDHIFFVHATSIKPYKESIFPLGLSDVAAFHQVLANFATQLHPTSETATGMVKYERDEVETRHNKALSILQKRMQDPDQATSDGTIATVIAMICFSHLQRDFTAWHSHINGLQEILKLQQRSKVKKAQDFEIEKSGILNLNSLLGTGIACVDVNGSASQDISPRFPLLQKSPAAPPLTLQYPPIVDTLITTYPDAPIYEIFLDIAAFIAHLSQELQSNTIQSISGDLTWNWMKLYPLSHKLYSFRVELDPNSSSSVTQECCRLALCIFLQHIRKELGISPALTARFSAQLLPLVQSSLFIPDSGESLRDFKIWVLVMGALGADGFRRTEFTDLLRTELQRWGIEAHVDLEELMMRVLWVGEIESERFWGMYGELWSPDDGTI